MCVRSQRSTAVSRQLDAFAASGRPVAVVADAVGEVVVVAVASVRWRTWRHLCSRRPNRVDGHTHADRRAVGHGVDVRRLASAGHDTACRREAGDEPLARRDASLVLKYSCMKRKKM
jgi:hypothetical protein